MEEKYEKEPDVLKTEKAQNNEIKLFFTFNKVSRDGMTYYFEHRSNLLNYINFKIDVFTAIGAMKLKRVETHKTNP